MCLRAREVKTWNSLFKRNVCFCKNCKARSENEFRHWSSSECSWCLCVDHSPGNKRQITYLLPCFLWFLQPHPPLVIQFDWHAAAAGCMLADPADELLEFPPQGGALLSGLGIARATLQPLWERRGETTEDEGKVRKEGGWNVLGQSDTKIGSILYKRLEETQTEQQTIPYKGDLFLSPKLWRWCTTFFGCLESRRYWMLQVCQNQFFMANNRAQ